MKLFRGVRSAHAIAFNSTEEKQQAFTQFQKNVNKIEHLNSNLDSSSSLRFGVTQFSLVGVSDFRSASMGVIIPKNNPLQGSVIVHGRPKELLGVMVRNVRKDWTGIYTTPVKNQGRCGCCYVFSAIAQIESDAIRLNRTSPLMQLSPQQPLDCGGPATAGGCGGGFPLNIYAYARRSGIVRHADYPYQGSPKGQCAVLGSAPIIVSVRKFNVFQSHVEEDIAVYVQNVGPLAAIVYADKWQHYTYGIMTAAACGYTGLVNHAVQIVGLDLTRGPNNQSYWIVSLTPHSSALQYQPLIARFSSDSYRFAISGERVGE